MSSHEEVEEIANSSEEKSGVHLIQRVAQILRLLSSSDSGLSQNEISNTLCLTRATAYRTLNALIDEGFVSAEKGRYRIGAEIARLASPVQRDFVREIRPFLESLSAEIDETAYVAVLDVNRAVIIDQVAGTQILRVVSPVGQRLPLHCTACGKSLLSLFSTSVATRMLGSSLPMLTPATHSSEQLLHGELAEVRRSGIAWNHDEFSEGISAAATAIAESPFGPIALGVPMPSIRFRGREQSFASALLSTRTDVQAKFHIAAGNSANGGNSRRAPRRAATA